MLFRVPSPDAVGGEDEIHLLQRALVGFRVEGPDDDDGEDIYCAEDVEGFFVEAFEDCREEEDLFLY